MSDHITQSKSSFLFSTCEGLRCGFVLSCKALFFLQNLIWFFFTWKGKKSLFLVVGNQMVANSYWFPRFILFFFAFFFLYFKYSLYALFFFSSYVYRLKNLTTQAIRFSLCVLKNKKRTNKKTNFLLKVTAV